jgi:hypothetical protein
MIVRIAALLLLCLGQRPALPVPAQGRDHFPTPKEGIVLEGGPESPRLEDVIRELVRVTGIGVSMSRECRQMLDQRPEPAFVGKVEIPPQEVYAFVEGLLWDGGFALVELHGGPPRLVALRPKIPGHELRQECIAVPAERIEDYADHPALLVRTVLELPSVDCQRLVNSLGGILTQGGVLHVSAMTATTVLICGSGRQVARLAKELRSVEQLAARAAAGAPPSGETPPK